MFEFVAALAQSPIPTPSPVVVQKVVETVREVPVTPDYINQLLFTGVLIGLGWLASFGQSVLNGFLKSAWAEKAQLRKRFNIALTFFYGVLAPTAIMLHDAGELDLSDVPKALSSAALVLLGAWVRYNGGKFAPAEGGGIIVQGGRTAAPSPDATLVPTKSQL